MMVTLRMHRATTKPTALGPSRSKMVRTVRAIAKTIQRLQTITSTRTGKQSSLMTNVLQRLISCRLRTLRLVKSTTISHPSTLLSTVRAWIRVMRMQKISKSFRTQLTVSKFVMQKCFSSRPKLSCSWVETARLLNHSTSSVHVPVLQQLAHQLSSKSSVNGTTSSPTNNSLC